MVKKSITVTTQQDAWIEAQIASGGYSNDSEVIREALREKQQRTAELEAIRAKLIASETSLAREGALEQTPEQILEGFKDRARRDGKL